MSETVTMWRCVECGKWSHAKKQPKFHERGMYDDGSISEDDPKINRRETYGGDLSDGSEDYLFLKCGPFEEWTAQKVQSSVLDVIDEEEMAAMKKLELAFQMVRHYLSTGQLEDMTIGQAVHHIGIDHPSISMADLTIALTELYTKRGTW